MDPSLFSSFVCVCMLLADPSTNIQIWRLVKITQKIQIYNFNLSIFLHKISIPSPKSEVGTSLALNLPNKSKFQALSICQIMIMKKSSFEALTYPCTCVTIPTKR